MNYFIKLIIFILAIFLFKKMCFSEDKPYSEQELKSGSYFAKKETREIEKDDFQAGHILAEANGGSIEIDNLVPICSQCNQGMGTMHMRDFIKEYFNENLKKFDKREKPLIKKKKKRLFTFGRD